MLDLTGPTRGTGTNELRLLGTIAKGVTVQSLASGSEAKAWQEQWPPETNKPVFKILYDRSAGEVRVLERRDGGTILKIFPVDQNLATALERVNAFIREQTGR